MGAVALPAYGFWSFEVVERGGTPYLEGSRENEMGGSSEPNTITVQQSTGAINPVSGSGTWDDDVTWAAATTSTILADDLCAWFSFP